MQPYVGIIADGQDLTEESDGHLTQLLRVADVAVYDLVEGQLLALLQVVLNLLGTGHNLTSDRILGLFDLWIDVVRAQRKGNVGMSVHNVCLSHGRERNYTREH